MNKHSKITKHDVGYTSLFFSTIYNKLYYIVSSIVLAIEFEVLTSFKFNVNMTIAYWLAIAVYSFTIWIVYIISKNIKKKHNKLEIDKLSSRYIVTRILIMFLYTMIMSMIVIILHIGILGVNII